jgi:hypothetical protein
LDGCQAAIAGKPAPTGTEDIWQKLVGWQAAIAAMRRPDKPAPTGEQKQKQNAIQPPLLLTTQQAER